MYGVKSFCVSVIVFLYDDDLSVYIPWMELRMCLVDVLLLSGQLINVMGGYAAIGCD